MATDKGREGGFSISGLTSFPLPTFLKEHKVMSKLGCLCMERRGGKWGTEQARKEVAKPQHPHPNTQTDTHIGLSLHSRLGPQASPGRRRAGSPEGSCPAGQGPGEVSRLRQGLGASGTTSLPSPGLPEPCQLRSPPVAPLGGPAPGRAPASPGPAAPSPRGESSCNFAGGWRRGPPGLGLVRLRASAATAAPLSGGRVPAP